MNSGLFFNNKKYISVSDASSATGYSKDYIGQLCRAEKLDCKRIGRVWYVSEDSILNYKNFPAGLESVNTGNLGESRPSEVPKTSKFSKYKHALSKGAFEFNTKYSKLILPAVIVLLLFVGFVSLSNDTLAFVEENGLNNFGQTVSKISRDISLAPSHLYTAMGDVSNLYTSALSESYVSVGNILTGQSGLENKKINVDQKNTAATLMSPNSFAQISIQTYDTINSFFDFYIYSPIASLFGKKTQIVISKPVTPAPVVVVSTNQSTTTKVTIVPPTPIKITPPPVVPPTKPVQNNFATVVAPPPAAPATIIEKIIQSVAPSDVTKDYVDTQLQILNNSIASKLAALSTGGGGAVTNIYQQIAQSQRINNLSDVTIGNPTITGGSISNTSISNVSVSASDLTATTLSTTATSSLAAPVGIGTTNPLTTLDVFGNMIFSGSNSYLNFGSTVGTNGYGIRDNAGQLEFKNLAGDWTGIGSGGGSGGGTFSTTTSTVANRLINHPINNTDIVTVGGSSTTTAKYYFDPNTLTANLLGATTLVNASTTVLTVLGNSYIPKLSNLTTNGFVKTSGGDGTLVVDTTTYLSSASVDAPLSGNGTSGSHLSISQSGSGSDGYLSSTDWNTFNNKVPTSITLTAGNGLTGGGDLSTNRSFAIDFTRANTWTGLQQFTANASTTVFSVSQNGTATTTILSNATSTFASGLSALYLNITGATATSTFANGINLSGGCLAVNGTCVSGSGGGSGTVTSITASTPNSTLTLGGTNPITTSGTISFDLNLGHANVWSALQQFSANASTTQISAGTAYFGQTATTTISGTGVVNVPTGASYQINSTNVLTANTLGSGILNSSLTSLGTLGSLIVSGLSNFGNASSSLFSSNYAQFGATATTTITSAGKLGVGTSSPTFNFEVNGTSYLGNTLTLASSTATTPQLLFIPGVAPTTLAAGNLYSTQTSTTSDVSLMFASVGTNNIADNLNNTITSSRNYYVCGKANGGTCVYNGDGGTVANPSDTNDCQSKATPCRTVSGVESKIHGKAIRGTTTVTINLADTANSGSDCYQELNLTFSNVTEGKVITQNGRLDTFPSAYLYILGNTTTPANVTFAGNTCGSATVGSGMTNSGLIFNGTVARVNGMQFEGYGSTDNAGGSVAAVVSTGHGVVYGENLTGIGNVQNQSAQSVALVGAYGTGSEADLGGAITVTHGMSALAAIQGGVGHTYDPSDTSSSFTNLSYTCATSETCQATLQALEGGEIYLDRLIYTIGGGGTFTFESAYLNARITAAEVYASGSASDCNGGAGSGKCMSGTFSNTLSASKYNYESSQENSYIDADCSNSLGFVCSVSVQPSVKGIAKTMGRIRDYTSGGGITVIFTNPQYTINSGGMVSTYNGVSANVDLAQLSLERFSVSSSTPFGQVSINPDALGINVGKPEFVIGSSSATHLIVTGSGFLGVGTSSPGSLLSLQGIANFTTATSSFAATGGINLTGGGCFAVNGVCVTGTGGSGTVTSITASTPNSTLTLGGTNPITSSGTISFDLNLANPNSWTGLQQFANASSTVFSVSQNGTATTTILSNATSTFANGVSATYLNLTGTAATSTFANGINLTGGCLSINGVCFTGGGNGSGTVTSVAANTPNSTLTIGGTNPITSSGTLSFDLNLGHTNTWTALQQFTNASSSNLSATYAQFGGTATTTITATGSVGIGTATPSALLEIGTTTSTNAIGGLYFGTDTVADLYRSAASTIKTDATLNVQGATWNGTLLTANAAGLTLRAGTGINQSTTGASVIIDTFNNYANTSGTVEDVLIGGTPTFQPSSGSGAYNTLEIRSNIAQGGSANGITRGIYINPIVISTATDYRALEISTTTYRLAISTSTTNSFLQNAYAIASTSATTVTNAYQEQITGAPMASANVTVSTSTALIISPGAVNAGGTVTNAYGLQVFAPTGATNNYAASFMNGNFGIGTSSPGTLFSIQGVANFSTATTSFASTGGINLASGCFAIGGTCITTIGSGSGTVGSGTTGQFPFYNAAGTTLTATSTLFITQAGFIGIGTTTPFAEFSINNVADFPAFVIGSSTKTLLTVDKMGSLIQNVASTSAVNIQDGSSNSIFKVDTTQASTNSGIDITAGGTQTGNLLNVFSNSGIYLSGFEADGGFLQNISSTSAFQLQNGSATAVFSVDTTNSRVGIGTSTPGTTLSIQGVANFSTATSSFASTGGLNLTAGGCFAISGTCIGTGGGTIGSGTTGQFPFYNANGTTLTATSTLFVTSAGLIGIGTSTPTSLLSLTGSAPGIELYNTAANGHYFKIRNGTLAAGSLDIFDATTGTTRWLMDAAGNVAIGTSTTNPLAMLDVASTTPAIVITDTNSSLDNKHWGLFNSDGVFSLGTTSDAMNATSSALSIQGNSVSVFGFASSSPWADFAVNSEGGDIAFAIGSSTATSFMVDKYGQVGLASTSPWRTFSVTGSVALNGLTAGAGAGSICLTAGKELTYSNNATCTVSSQRFKHDIANLDENSGLSELMQLNPVTFEYNADLGIPGTQVGFIAEQVLQVDPRLVVLDASSTPYTVRYEQLTAVLAKSIQQLDLNVESIASTTATSTPATTAFVTSFFQNIFSHVATWLADAANGIQNIFTKQLTTNTLCVSDDGGAKTCITKGELDKLLANTSSSGNSGGSSGGESTSTPDGAATTTVDTTAPVITILGDNPATIPVGATYSDMGATVTDTNADGSINNNLGLHFNVDGVDETDISIDTSTSTTHTIIYSATDGAGNIGTSTRTVIVQ